MSASSKSSSKKKAIDAPFDKKVEKRAREIAVKYRVMIEEEDGHYYGCAVEMPYCMGDGPTVDACFDSTMQGIIAGVATMLENGDEPPLAVGENRRTEQVNVHWARLSDRPILRSLRCPRGGS
jgi:predicted RNase H-like HicB family nuclease